MGSGEFGGDGSVRFKMHVQHRRAAGKARTPGADSDDLVDDVADGLAFTISIKLPSAGEALSTIQSQLYQAASAPAGTKFILTLPIERGNDTSPDWPQIDVEWPDTPKAAH